MRYAGLAELAISRGLALQFRPDLIGVVLTCPGDDLRVGRLLHQPTQQIPHDRLIQGARDFAPPQQ